MKKSLCYFLFLNWKIIATERVYISRYAVYMQQNFKSSEFGYRLVRCNKFCGIALKFCRQG